MRVYVGSSSHAFLCLPTITSYRDPSIPRLQVHYDTQYNILDTYNYNPTGQQQSQVQLYWTGDDSTKDSGCDRDTDAIQKPRTSKQEAQKTMLRAIED